MDFLEACLKNDGRQAVNALRKILGSAKPSAIWAILMHAAAWHEERTYDTPHAMIMVYATQRMIEDLGPNPDLIEPDAPAGKLVIPEDLRGLLQSTLIQRLAYHLAELDHWRPESGPKYNVDLTPESMSNAVQQLELSVRKRSQTGVLKAALVLASKGEPVRLMRAAAALASEEPDRLGHGFILPVSLITELPAPEYTRPQTASLWHMAEYLVRKVPSERTVGAGLDARISKYAKPTDISDRRNTIATSVAEYGILGHNGIFAHRIAEAASRGWVATETVDWLFKVLSRNTARDAEPQEVSRLMKKTSGRDWQQPPSALRLPDSDSLGSWLAENSEFWTSMLDTKSEAFESLIESFGDEDYGVVRASQYALASINGEYQASHPVIFTQAVWSLVDHGLISKDLAALQVHRMLRQYL
jgi:hypothetical protein